MRLLQLAFIVALASGFSAILIYLTGVSNLDSQFRISSEDLEALKSLQIHFQKCVFVVHSAHFLAMQSANGLGLQAVLGKDNCEVSLKFPKDTTPKWKDPKTGELEGLTFDFNLCEAVATWEQVRNSTTILTREFIDALPNGWEEYAWRRINKGVLLNGCKNRTLCMEKLSLVLPDRPPYTPRQFGRCAVIGNSGDLLKTKFGDEIDGYDAVVRENGAPIQNFTAYVGTKSTFRLLNRGSAKALDKVAELYDKGKEVLIVKTTIHDIMNKMIQEIPILNPVYLMLGASFGSAAKGTGLKALEFALSMCDTVDMYGFTVDPGYKEWWDKIFLRISARPHPSAGQGVLSNDGMSRTHQNPFSNAGGSKPKCQVGAWPQFDHCCPNCFRENIKESWSWILRSTSCMFHHQKSTHREIRTIAGLKKSCH
ncbi:Sialyltransferase-like protein 2 [Castilleja foliolosa]|uniref:Sialyltransferase-like protein 2 n=1 Tax=Castilleja foliolosa TaxID=1961234 RepID=A0ABD3EPP7_9LAMI